MNYTNEALQILAQQMGEDTVSSRAEIEGKLARLLCLILRTGRGHPSLVQWVQLTLPEVAPASQIGREVDPKWAAPRLARLLYSQLLRNTRNQRNTVVNRLTVVA